MQLLQFMEISLYSYIIIIIIIIIISIIIVIITITIILIQLCKSIYDLPCFKLAPIVNLTFHLLYTLRLFMMSFKLV